MNKQISTGIALMAILFGAFGCMSNGLQPKEINYISIEISTDMSIQEVVAELSHIGIMRRPQRPGELAGMYFNINDHRTLRVVYEMQSGNVTDFLLTTRPRKDAQGEAIMVTKRHLHAITISHDRVITSQTIHPNGTVQIKPIEPEP